MASRYHKAVRRIVSRVYPDREIRDEQNLWEVIKAVMPPRQKKSYNRLFIDIYLPEENLAIEVHGEQHEKPIQFAKELDAEEALTRRKHLDFVKSDALQQAGVATVIIWHGDIEGLTSKELKRRIFIARQMVSTIPVQKVQLARPAAHRTADEAYKAREKGRSKYRRKRTETPEQRQKRLDKARAARKAAYQRAKERKKNGS